jgi:fatty-acyl-CoA synthase
MTDTGTMQGLMMAEPLTITHLMRAAIKNHPQREIVTRTWDDRTERVTYAEFGRRVARLANGLRALGVKPGDRVASFGWNSLAHLELYYAVPCMGAILHTTNVRLFPEQVAYVFDHANDSVVIFDTDLVPAIARANATAPQQAARRTHIVIGNGPDALPGAIDFASVSANQPDTYDWPELDENAAAIVCYTSATTGNPKGVMFSHRSTRLHALFAGLPDSLGVHQYDTVMPVVPMFHVNAWGLPFIALQAGAKLVLPGRRLDAPSLVDLMASEGVTLSAGVPTIWIAVYEELRKREMTLPALRNLIIGGSAVPPALLDRFDAIGTTVSQAWGMTEMSPIGTVGYVKAELRDAPPERRREARLKQGVFHAGLEWKLLDDDGNEVPSDGIARGELYVRGPATARSYYNPDPGVNDAFVDGWFRTGDICTVDEYGYMAIVDRAKDLIKSGGEWISSVDVENELMGHPAILEACVVGVPHAKWIERPIACVVPRAGETIDETAIRTWLETRIAKWWIPDRIVTLEAIPRTGVGKFLKRELRAQFAQLLSAD